MGHTYIFYYYMGFIVDSMKLISSSVSLYLLYSSLSVHFLLKSWSGTNWKRSGDRSWDVIDWSIKNLVNLHFRYFIQFIAFSSFEKYAPTKNVWVQICDGFNTWRELSSKYLPFLSELPPPGAAFVNITLYLSTMFLFLLTLSLET